MLSNQWLVLPDGLLASCFRVEGAWNDDNLLEDVIIEICYIRLPFGQFIALASQTLN